MLQRIQTVFLLVSAFLLGAMFYLPMAHMISGASTFAMTLKGVGVDSSSAQSFSWLPAWPLEGLAIAVVLLIVVATSSYKNRPLQFRLTRWAIILTSVFVGVLFYSIKRNAQICESAYSIDFWAFLPLIVVLLLVWAARAIRKDEELVRSIDRIR